MTKSNKILCIVGAILIAFVGLFGIVFATQDDRVVKADEVVTNNYFVSSTFYSGVGYSTNTSVSSISQNAVIGYRFWLNVANGNWGSTGNYFAFNSFPLQGVAQPLFHEIVYDNWNWLAHRSFTYSSPNYYVNLGYYVNSGFDINNIYKLSIGSYEPAFGNTAVGAQTFTYFDSAERMFQVQIAYGLNYHSGVLSSRTYYFTTDLSSNQYYNAGVEYGRDLGADEGFDVGYQKCIDDNKQNWIEQGRLQGITQANDYTFLGLIGATIDAPISALFGRLDTDSESPTYNQYVGGFFNFELLGVNLRSFFFAILTFALVIVIIRFALAR